MKEAIFTLSELKAAGFTAVELQAEYYDLADGNGRIEALSELKEVGFTALELKQKQKQQDNRWTFEKGRRLTVGDKVLVDGQRGVISRDDHDSQPYKVRFTDGNESSWKKAEQVQLVEEEEEEGDLGFTA